MICNKNKYRKKKSAKIALAFCNVLYFSGKENRLEKRIYWCDICKAYHLTSK